MGNQVTYVDGYIQSDSWGPVLRTVISAAAYCDYTNTPLQTQRYDEGCIDDNPPPSDDGGDNGACSAFDNPDAQSCYMWYGSVGGYWNPDGCYCYVPQGSPILIDIEGDGFSLTDNANGVRFNLDGVKEKEKISWTSAGSDDAWLALDRNGNGIIDNGKELFGNYTEQSTTTDMERQGFLALAEYDKSANGGNNDGVIDVRDNVFTTLLLWQDKNHNGLSESSELYNLPSLDIDKIELNYHESKRTDEFGNKFKYRAKVWDANKARTGRWAWDVFLLKGQ